MSFELHRRKHIDGDLTKIARRELRRASDTLSRSDPGAFGTSIHEARKRVKKVRAVLEVIEWSGGDVPGKNRKRLEKAGRELSALRDSAAIIDTFDRVRRRYPKRLPEHTYGILRRGLVEASEQRERRARHDGVASDVAAQLEKTGRAAKHWTVPAIGLSQLVAVARASYRRSRKAMERARETGRSATLHRFRAHAPAAANPRVCARWPSPSEEAERVCPLAAPLVEADARTTRGGLRRRCKTPTSSTLLRTTTSK